ncbi:MAG TPA: hypothetical protein PKW95_02805 [bacterium]|nr:hypothetical protein [bacterium]
MSPAFRHVRLLLAILLLIVAGSVRVAPVRAAEADPPVIKRLIDQFRAYEAEKILLDKKKDELLVEQNKLADEIETIKAEDPGLLARMRLERLLSRNLEVSRQLDETEKALEKNRSMRRELKKKIYYAYTGEMESTINQMRETKNKKSAADLARRFYTLQQRRDPWRISAAVEQDFSLFKVEIEPLDGPAEILNKADILDDLVAKIRTAIARIDQRIKVLQREQRLAGEMRDLVSEMNLFQEGVRFHTGESAQPRVLDPDEEQPDEQGEGGLHIPPLAGESDSVPGSDRATLSIQQEIKKLTEERQYLVRLSAKLSAKAADFRKKARSMRKREKPPKPTVQRNLNSGNKQ